MERLHHRARVWAVRAHLLVWTSKFASDRTAWLCREVETYVDPLLSRAMRGGGVCGSEIRKGIVLFERNLNGII